MERDDRKKQILKINKKIAKLEKEGDRLRKKTMSEERIKSKQDTHAFINNANGQSLSIRIPNQWIGWDETKKKRARQQEEEEEEEDEEDLSYHRVFQVEELRLMILDHLGPLELSMVHATSKRLQEVVILSFPVLFEWWIKRLQAPLMQEITKAGFATSVSHLRKIKRQYADCPPLILPHLHQVFVCYRNYGPLRIYTPSVFRKQDPPIQNEFVIVHDKQANSFKPATEYSHFSVPNYNNIVDKRYWSFYEKHGFSVKAQFKDDYLRYKDYVAMKFEPINHDQGATLVIISGEEMISTKHNDRLSYYYLVTNESLATRSGFVKSMPFLDLYECRVAITATTKSWSSAQPILSMQSEITKLNDKLRAAIIL